MDDIIIVEHKWDKDKRDLTFHDTDSVITLTLTKEELIGLKGQIIDTLEE